MSPIRPTGPALRGNTIRIPPRAALKPQKPPFDTPRGPFYYDAMPGEPENQFSLTRASAEYMRPPKKQILISNTNSVPAQTNFLKWVKWRIAYDVSFNITLPSPTCTTNLWIFEIVDQGAGMGPSSPTFTNFRVTTTLYPLP